MLLRDTSHIWKFIGRCSFGVLLLLLTQHLAITLLYFGWLCFYYAAKQANEHGF